MSNAVRDSREEDEVEIVEEEAALSASMPVTLANYQTVEGPPASDNYLHSVWNVRPSHQTIELGAMRTRGDTDSLHASQELLAKQKSQRRFGTIDGVVVHCLLTIWGVMLFVRMGWIVANAGVSGSLIIVGVAFVTTLITALSLSAICTNGDIGAGGTYTLVARTLGPAWGASIGIVFSFANSVSVALYSVGCAETLQRLLHDVGVRLPVDDLSQIRMLGAIVLCTVLLLCMFGVDYMVKFDIWLLVIIVVTLVFFVIGTFTTAPNPAIAFTGYSAKTFSKNWHAQYESGESLLTVFSVFFPAMTGMMAGASMSGDLKNPQVNIPHGTLWSITMSTVVYAAVICILGATVERLAPDDTRGLYHNFYVMVDVAPWKWLVFFGILCSTFSSAVASIIVAPRILKAVCDDGLFPYLSYFARGRASDNEPIRGYLLSFIVALFFIMIGEINLLAPWITNFFLANRTLVNVAVFVASKSHSPGWRPSWRYYHPLLSLAGAVSCVVLMFALGWKSALAITLVCMVIFRIVSHRAPKVGWGDYRHSRLYLSTTKGILDLQNAPSYAKNFRPSFLIVTDSSSSSSSADALLHFADLMRAGRGLVFVGEVVQGAFEDYVSGASRDGSLRMMLAGGTGNVATPAPPAPHHHPRALIVLEPPSESSSTSMEGVTVCQQAARRPLNACVDRIVAPDYLSGFRTLLQTSGVGSIRPNVLLMQGGPGLVSRCPEASRALVDQVWSALRMKYCVCLLRGAVPSQPRANATIDVYWLVDTGGLTLLLPYLLMRHPRWASSGCSLRLFLHGSRFRCHDADMVRLVKQFRIDVKAVHHIDLDEPPPDASWDAFPGIADLQHRVKMARYLRLGECIRSESADAAVVFVTLPYPRRLLFTEQQIAQWLDAIVAGVPAPVVFVRGNQENVLTLRA